MEALLTQSWHAWSGVMGSVSLEMSLEHCVSVGVISSGPRRMYDWAKESIRGRGLLTTMSVAFSAVADLTFDWRHGTDTARVVPIGEMNVRSENTAHAVHYQATKAGPLAKLLRRLRFPEGSVFVDFGSGKGRVLLLAAQEKFKRVVGVEFSSDLCAVARKNVELFRQKRPSLASVEIVEADAASYLVRPDENVFFLFNPFDEVVLAKVVQRIGESLAAHPRAAWMIYCTPRHARVVDEASCFDSHETLNFGGMEFRIYANQAATNAARGAK
jgi:SAM-dependent methyltransferase